MVGEQEFKEIYLNNLEKISTFVNEKMLQGMSSNDKGYTRLDLMTYYKIEWKKYFHAYRIILGNMGEGGGERTLCDCGGLLGIFALTMADLGFEVSIVEALKYYNDSFDELYTFLRSRQVRIIDWDMFDTEKMIDCQGNTYDCVCAMDVIEHYPYSLKYYMENLKSLSKRFIYLTAPNIAVIHKRVDLFLDGVSPLANIAEVYHSAIPFTGHHHEMTMYELEKLAELADLNVVEKNFNSSYYYGEGIRKPIYKWIHHCFPNTRENLAILLEKR